MPAFFSAFFLDRGRFLFVLTTTGAEERWRRGRAIPLVQRSQGLPRPFSSHAGDGNTLLRNLRSLFGYEMQLVEQLSVLSLPCKNWIAPTALLVAMFSETLDQIHLTYPASPLKVRKLARMCYVTPWNRVTGFCIRQPWAPRARLSFAYATHWTGWKTCSHRTEKNQGSRQTQP